MTRKDVLGDRSLGRPSEAKYLPLQAITESLPIGLLLVDDEGMVSELNPALAESLAIERESLLGLSYTRFFDLLARRATEPEVVQQSLQQAVVAVNERPVVEISIGGERRRHLEMAFFPVWSESKAAPGWGGLIQDVTEARDRLAWKIELLSMLAHDIRTPLATLKGHATALLANYRRWGDSMVLEFLEAMDRGTDELVRHVERSLALTRVEAGRLGLRPEAVKPGPLIHQSAERAAAALGEAEVRIQASEDLPPVRVDPARIEEVLVNLLENAARYNPPEAPLVVRAEPQETMLVFSVIDSGPGVPRDQHEVIFQKYGQIDSGHDGSGLGLFISRKIVEAHGGRIWVESPAAQEERGAKFSFSVPLMPDQAAPGSPPADARHAPTTDPTDAQILIVEDEADLQALLRAILTEAGYQVHIVGDGPPAVDLLTSSEPDLILLDWILPSMDGLSLCRTIRRWSSVPILVITSKTSQEDLIEALDAGADDYLTKPFQSPELLARIRALLRRGERYRLEEAAADQFRGRGLTIDYPRRQVLKDGRPVALTPTEFDLLAYLSRHRHQVLSHDQLIRLLWGEGTGSRHNLFVHINRLRKKIESDPDNPEFIVTRWGVGYAFIPQ